jgi:hypothetical protein
VRRDRTQYGRTCWLKRKKDERWADRTGRFIPGTLESRLGLPSGYVYRLNEKSEGRGESSQERES